MSARRSPDAPTFRSLVRLSTVLGALALGMAGAGAVGLRITGGSSLVRALAINRFTGNGIELTVNGENVLEANYLGTDLTGTLDQADDPSRHVRFLLSKVLPVLHRAKEPR